MELYKFQGQTIWPVNKPFGDPNDPIKKYISCPKDKVDEFSGVCLMAYWIERTKEEYEEEQKCLHS